MQNNCKFLIIDDNETDQFVTKLLLEKKLGISDVTSVFNGVEALEWMQANQDPLPNCLVILLDVRMPEMDGFAFLDTFEKMDEKFKKITQIFMLSSTLDPQDIERAEGNAHVKKLLTKPLPTQLLSELIGKS